MQRLALLALPLLTACTYVATPPGDIGDRRVVYQAIADALPRADLGFGDAPGTIDMARSVKQGEKPPEPEPLRCNERGFMVHFAVFQPRAQWIPYSALRQATYGWKPFPNVITAPLLIIPLQAVRATIVFDAKKVPGLLEHIEQDCVRLEKVGRELGLGGPWSHAQDVRAKLAGDAAEYGDGCVSLEVAYLVPVPAWLPTYGPARAAAEAFAWVQAHPDEPVLPDEPPPPPAKK